MKNKIKEKREKVIAWLNKFVYITQVMTVVATVLVIPVIVMVLLGSDESSSYIIKFIITAILNFAIFTYLCNFVVSYIIVFNSGVIKTSTVKNRATKSEYFIWLSQVSFFICFISELITNILATKYSWLKIIGQAFGYSSIVVLLFVIVGSILAVRNKLRRSKNDRTQR